MENVDLVVKYDGVEIEYRESDDKWFFELRGRERSADSLKLAKEAIDKPEPKARKKFDPIKAFRVGRQWSDCNNFWEPVTVTSLAENASRWSTGIDVWVSDSKKKREKVSADTVYLENEVNANICIQIDRKWDEIDKLKNEKDALFESLEKIDVSVLKEGNDGSL